MPVRIEYTKDKIGVVLHHEGVVSGEELINSVSKVYSDERYLNLRYWIGDRTSCTEFLPDTRSLKIIAELSKQESSRNPGILLALVAPNDLEFGMSRMFEFLAGESLFITKVFRARSTADKWIRQGLETP
ncbi:MAG: hypothetical protein ACN4GM_02475 [Gammaproteobacteria bacterium]